MGSCLSFLSNYCNYNYKNTSIPIAIVDPEVEKSCIYVVHSDPIPIVNIRRIR